MDEVEQALDALKKALRAEMLTDPVAEAASGRPADLLDVLRQSAEDDGAVAWAISNAFFSLVEDGKITHELRALRVQPGFKDPPDIALSVSIETHAPVYFGDDGKAYLYMNTPDADGPQWRLQLISGVTELERE